MTWQYKISTGAMSQDGAYVATGYSGHGAGLNNPAYQNARDVGPLPAGQYTIGPPRNPVDLLGPLAMPLTPAPGNNMFGRDAFFIHGDNAAGNHSASDGCIILDEETRATINDSNDQDLIVIT